MPILSITAKCSGMFSASMDGKEYDGYVPDFMPGDHYGDYVMLEIDIETGHIVNWKKPSKADLDKVFKSDDDSEEEE